MRKISEEGLQSLKQLEGFKALAYDDARPNYVLSQGDKILGTLTIGYGHTLNVSIGQKLNESQATQVLELDLDPVEDVVYNSVKVPLKDNQFDALVIFTYNVGIPSFQSSTLLAKLNQGLYDEIPAQLQRWNKTTINGKLVVSEGLIKRRKAECDIWNNQLTPTQPNLMSKLKQWLTFR